MSRRRVILVGLTLAQFGILALATVILLRRAAGSASAPILVGGRLLVTAGVPFTVQDLTGTSLCVSTGSGEAIPPYVVASDTQVAPSTPAVSAVMVSSSVIPATVSGPSAGALTRFNPTPSHTPSHTPSPTPSHTPSPTLRAVRHPSVASNRTLFGMKLGGDPSYPSAYSFRSRVEVPEGP